MNDTHYIVSFKDLEKAHGEKAVSLKVNTITDSNLGLGFIRISDFIFAPQSGIVVDPTQYALRARYENTKSLHLSLHQIVTIEEVGSDHQGLHLTQDRSNLINLPPRHEH